MGMPASDKSIATIQELLTLPDDGLRHELLEGEHVVTPAPQPAHQRAVRRLMHSLDQALEAREDVELYTSPADIVLGPQTLVQPDVFVVAKTPGKPIAKWSDVGVPVLAIEILSPATAARDRGTKRRIYQQAGVGEYWIVDLDARLIERWKPGDLRPEIVTGTLAWDLGGGGSGASGELDLPYLFRAIES